MRAMVLRKSGQAMGLEQRESVAPGIGDVRLRVLACGVCRTDLHLLDGELPQAQLPVVPGHEIVGRVEAIGSGVSLQLGDQVGVPWLGSVCGECQYCRSGAENLCDAPQFTGCSRDGGFATEVIARADFCLPMPVQDFPDPVAAAPLLCAGLIGWRALRLAGDPGVLGLYGFGAAGHLLIQVARSQGRQVLVFTRPGDSAAQRFARELGACWAGDSTAAPPLPLDAAILFAPVGELVPLALAAVRKGGVVVCGGIHMTPIPSFPYDLLWQERKLLSVANLTRQDGQEYLRHVAAHPLQTHTHSYPLADANLALDDLRHGRFTGAAVLQP
jgi:propanol-preferring alcohol dehydrogenase